jgi:hypothetical protein
MEQHELGNDMDVYKYRIGNKILNVMPSWQIKKWKAA